DRHQHRARPRLRLQNATAKRTTAARVAPNHRSGILRSLSVRGDGESRQLLALAPPVWNVGDHARWNTAAVVVVAGEPAWAARRYASLAGIGAKTRVSINRMARPRGGGQPT